MQDARLPLFAYVKMPLLPRVASDKQRAKQGAPAVLQSYFRPASLMRTSLAHRVTFTLVKRKKCVSRQRADVSLSSRSRAAREKFIQIALGRSSRLLGPFELARDAPRRLLGGVVCACASGVLERPSFRVAAARAALGFN